MKCEGELINMTWAWDNVFQPTELLENYWRSGYTAHNILHKQHWRYLVKVLYSDTNE